MENNLENILLELKNHERKSRMLTLLLVGLFITSAMVLYYFARNSNSGKSLNTLNNNKSDTIIYLNNINQFYNSDSTKNIEINKLNEINKELKRELLNCSKSLQSSSNNNVTKIKENINTVLNTATNNSIPQKSYIVYIKSNDSTNKEIVQINKIRQWLQNLKYNVPKEEFQNREELKTCVIYFHDEDKKYAEEILATVNKIYKSAFLQKSNIKSPTKQIEIWLNTYQ